MPYTLAHPLYAVPLKHLAPRYLCTTGLLLGSMAPDLEYFVAFESNKTIGHSVAGFFLLGLPLCTAFAIAFHRLMKPSLVQLLPSAFGLDKFAREHAAPWGLRTGRDWLLFIFSLFIGFWTHIFMDALSHRNSFIVTRIPFLQKYIHGEFVYHWLQYALSILGLGVIFVYLLIKWSRWSSTRREPFAADQVRFRWGMRLLVFAISGVLFFIKLKSDPSMTGYGFTMVAPISSLAVGWFVASALQFAVIQQKLAQLMGLLGVFAGSVVAFQLAQKLPFTSVYQHLGWVETILNKLGPARWELAVWIGFIWLWSFIIIAISMQRQLRSRRPYAFEQYTSGR
ncbi:DUF4184 family protein [Paenibacillus sp. GCM10012307]|uniref:DUF4184 family protein n=1 Tax=Paenibacillus roseus TaxID=2798579 RepID=A0A934JBM0_9BACL|nr:DUF4184 family protein [Paenibacillus roseus]MBJ6364072.1 DUF4184 family protein [Paenibacillus roseus]